MNRQRFAALVAAATVLVACSPEPSEFGRSAERLLEEELAADPGGTWTVTCTEPLDAEVDTSFTCTANDGTTQRTFTGRISSRSKFVVTADAAAAPIDPAVTTTVAAPPTSAGG